MDKPPLDGQRRKEVLRQCLSVGVATGTYGISFGALSVAAGLSLWQTIALAHDGRSRSLLRTRRDMRHEGDYEEALQMPKTRLAEREMNG